MKKIELNRQIFPNYHICIPISKNPKVLFSKFRFVSSESQLYSRQTNILIFSSIFQDLLACLAPTEVQQMLDELASDPDDKHVPASVRNAYRCEKQPTGPLDHTSLVSHIKVSS